MQAVKQKEDYFLSDEHIIQEILSGKTEMFELLMRRNNQSLYRAIRSYVQNEQDIKDIMQETYLSSFKMLYQFKKEAAFSTWLIRIGINASLQFLKRNKKRMRSIDEKDPASKIIQIADTPQNNPEWQSINAETHSLLEKAVDQLPKKYRLVYVLKEVEDMKIREIAICLDLSISNVKVRLHRARSLLKESLFQLSSDKSIFEFGNKNCNTLVENVMLQLLKT